MSDFLGPKPLTVAGLDAATAAKIGNPASATATALSATYGHNLGLGKIVALGTSIAFGAGASNTGTAYPAKIASHLQTMLGQAYTVVAAGVSGDNTGKMLLRLPALLAQHRPTFVTIEAAVNDTRSDFPTSDISTEIYLRKMIAQTRLAGAIPVLITAAQYDVTWLNSTGNNSFNFTSPPGLLTKNAIVRALGTELRVPVVDLFEALRGKINILADGLHPNDAGHNLWGQAIAQAISQQLVSNVQTISATDTFDRADNASVIGTASDGGTWTVTGNWGISGNRAYSPGGGGQTTAVRDSASTDHTVSVTTGLLVDNSAKAPFGLVVRYTDDNNYYWLDMTPAGLLRVAKKVAGAAAFIGITLTPTWAAGDEFSFSVDDSHLAVYQNGVAIWGVTDTGLTGGTKAGMWNTASNGSTWAAVKITK